MVQYQKWLIAANRGRKFLTLPSIITIATLTMSYGAMADTSSYGKGGDYNGNRITGTTLADLGSPGDGGTPVGRKSPGTSRPEVTCPDSDHDITALIHNQGSDITSILQPTLWFYTPYSQSEIQSIRFVLWDDRERNILLESSFEFLGEPGFLGVTLPDSVTLEDGQLYRWYFHVTCTGNPSLEPDKSVNGWMLIRQGDLLSQEAGIPDLMERGDWYDAIDLATRSYAANPELYRNQWLTVLEQVGASHLSTEFVGEPVLLIDK